jgi:hypothetical protein
LTESNPNVQELALEGDTKIMCSREKLTTPTTFQQLYYLVLRQKKLSTLKILGKISSEFFGLLISFTHSIKPWE